MQQYYGMVKCIDHNIGKLMSALKNLNVDQETIVVFTSDHGDTLMEHGKLNKNTPYETSAGIPFIVRYPEKIQPGKVVETAYSSVDFAPTILGLMDVQNPSGVSFQGIDGSEDLLNQEMEVKNANQIIFSFGAGKRPNWASAIKSGYKLVIQSGDYPWLIDLNIDPEETINYIDSLNHKVIKEELQNALVKGLNDYKMGITQTTPVLYLDLPQCRDSKDVLPIQKKGKRCKDLGDTVNIEKCQNQVKVRNKCPATCGSCGCHDSDGMFYYAGASFTCSNIETNMCSVGKIKKFCRKTCNDC